MNSKSSPTRNSTNLLEAAKYGDKHAFNKIIEQCYLPIKKYCAAMIDAQSSEDLAQETILRALKSKSIKSEVKSIEAFLIQIAKNLCFDLIKHKQKIAKIYDHKNQHLENFDFESNEECERILSFIEIDLRESFVLTQLLDFSYEECSHILEIPLGTVRSRTSRAKLKLQHVLKQEKASCSIEQDA